MFNSEISRLAIKKRAVKPLRELQMMQSEENVPVFIEKTARAISDWHSEADWPLHVDQAKRVAEAIAELLHREGLKDASQYIRSHIFTEPKPRRKQERV
jgi:hypothetical protein